jgi:hypothetical protein
MMALHTNPKYWAESLEWKPSRWVISNTVAGVMHDEKIVAPAKSAFYSWPAGP